MGRFPIKIPGADDQFQDQTHRDGEKEKTTNFLDFLPLATRERFPLADEGKGPFNSFSPHRGCCQTRWGSLRCLPPATSRNKWSKPAPFQANFFPVRLEPAGRRGVVSPESSSAPARGWGRLGVRKRQLSGFRSNFHPPPGGSPDGQRGGLRGGERAFGGTGGGRRAAGEAAAAAGRRERAGGGVLGLSLPPPYFRHLTPSAKRAVPPRRRWLRLVLAGLGGSTLRGRARGPRATCRAPRGRRRPRRPRRGP